MVKVKTFFWRLESLLYSGVVIPVVFFDFPVECQAAKSSIQLRYVVNQRSSGLDPVLFFDKMNLCDSHFRIVHHSVRFQKHPP